MGIPYFTSWHVNYIMKRYPGSHILTFGTNLNKQYVRRDGNKTGTLAKR